MAGWLKSLQKREMCEAAKNVIIAWSLVCAVALIAGLSAAADMDNIVTRAFVKVLTIDFWAVVWAYPVLGLGIIAFVTSPRASAVTKAR